MIKKYMEYVEYKINEDIYSAKKKYGDHFSDEFYNYVNNNIKNKHYVDQVCYIVNNSIDPEYIDFADVDHIINDLEYYMDTKTYLKFNFDDSEYVTDKTLKSRNDLLKKIIEVLPSNFRKNNKDIRGNYLDISNKLETMYRLYTDVMNKKENVLNKINNIVSASNKSIDDIINLLQHKYNLDDIDEPITLEEIENIEDYSQGTIIQSDVTKISDTKYLIRIDSFEAMQAIGKSSYWCHTYQGGEGSFYDYTYDGVTYVMVDLELNGDQHLMVFTNRFFNGLYDGVIEQAFDLYDSDNDAYVEMEDNSDFESMLYDKYNRDYQDIVSFLKGFFKDYSYQEIYDMLDT